MNPFNDSNTDNSYDLDKRHEHFVNQMTIIYLYTLDKLLIFKYNIRESFIDHLSFIFKYISNR